MANLLRINLKVESDVEIIDNELVCKPISANDTTVSVYAETDEISTWVGSITSVEELYDLVGPENLIDTLSTTASEYEYNCLSSALCCQDNKYLMINKLLTAIEGE